MMLNKQKPLPPLIESWIRDLHDPKINIWIRENSMRELMEIRDRIDEAVRMFTYEKDKVVSKKKRR